VAFVLEVLGNITAAQMKNKSNTAAALVTFIRSNFETFYLWSQLPESKDLEGNFGEEAALVTGEDEEEESKVERPMTPEEVKETPDPS